MLPIHHSDVTKVDTEAISGNKSSQKGTTDMEHAIKHFLYLKFEACIKSNNTIQ